MQNQQIIDITSGNTNSQHIGTDGLNGNRLNDRGGFVTATGANGNKYILEHIDPSQLADEDSDSEDGVSGMGGMYGKMAPGGNGPKPGKKTKGRVKIKMEFIENKLRRYTTFSKRKTGIMKKAYELSTLTGTQVMLLVASETGHVYTFATRKLQPMITSESGKALIQTCLNSPEAPPGSQMSMEQRMNPSGFEETELTYGLGDEDGKTMIGEGNSTMFPGMTDNNHNITSSSSSSSAQSSTHQYSSSISSLSQSTTNRDTISPPKTMSMQNANIIFQSGASVIPIPTPSSHITTSSPSTPQPQQTLYRLQQSNPVLSINTGQGTSNTDSTTTVQSLSLATPSALIAGSSHNNNNNNNSNNNSAVTPSILMYQTAQGIVYATPTDRIFNYQQPATALSVAQSDSTPMSGGQIIAIPVPVSLPNSAQMIQLAAPPQSHQSQHMEVGEISHQQPPPNKKQRK